MEKFEHIKSINIRHRILKLQTAIEMLEAIDSLNELISRDKKYIASKVLGKKKSAELVKQVEANKSKLSEKENILAQLLKLAK